MKSRHSRLIFLCSIISVLLACTITSRNIPPDSELPDTTESAENEPSSPSLPTVSPSSIINDEYICDPESWKIIVANVIQYPIGDGWKFVIVEFALENASVYWGNLNVSNVTITTEDGFVYEPISGYLKFPAEPPTRYSGDHFTSDFGSNSFFIHERVPPGFVVKGDNRGFGRSEQILNYIFQVAENQQQFIINGKKYVSCIDDTGESVYSSASELTLNLNDVAKPKFQIIVGRGGNIEPLLNNPIELSGAGTFQVYKIERSHPQYNEDFNAIYLYYTFTNGNQGYEVRDSITGYIIGDDGMIKVYGCPQTCDTADGQYGGGSLRAGPGQTTEGIYGLPVPPNVRNLMFILEWEGTLQLFDLGQ